MESAVIPTPREHMHTIIPHGHTRRVPAEAACRILEIPASTLCCCENPKLEYSTGAAAASTRPTVKFVEEAAPVKEPHPAAPEKVREPEAVVAAKEAPIPIAITFHPKESSGGPSRSVSSEEYPSAPLTDGSKVGDAQPSTSWLNCCDTACCAKGRQRSDPEEIPQAAPVDSIEPKPTNEIQELERREAYGSCWSLNLCGSCAGPEQRSISTYTEESQPHDVGRRVQNTETRPSSIIQPPVQYAGDPQPQPEQPVVSYDGELSARIEGGRAVGGAERKGKVVVYIDHYPEPFVKSYFGDEEAEEVPDNCGDFRFMSAAEILLAAGSAVGVIVTGGAVAIGAGALTAGLTVGIAATELYKRLTNNYDI
ncbi:hypothetical protein Efla_002021 [Eimeria flavescens]